MCQGLRNIYSIVSEIMFGMICHVFPHIEYRPRGIERRPTARGSQAADQRPGDHVLPQAGLGKYKNVHWFKPYTAHI